MEVNNKVLVELVIPEINQRYDVYLPINKKIGTIIDLLTKSINEFNNSTLSFKYLYNADTRECYSYDVLLINTKVRNGTKIILMR